MRLTIILFTVVVLIGGGWYYWDGGGTSGDVSEVATSTNGVVSDRTLEQSVVAENLEIPWDIAFLPDGGILVTERPGRVLLIAGETRTNIPVADIQAKHTGEGGLLGSALHPDFATNSHVYLYMTAEAQDGNGLVNRVVRYTFTGTALEDPVPIIESIPGAPYHDGGRIRFGPDGKLYITTGDATVEANAQNRDLLAGKILRLNPDGSIPDDNPFGTAVYSYGHRNPQGLTWDGQNRLWSTEHGRSGVRSGFDELNLITAGRNYGWPDSQGDTVEEGTVSPVVHSGADTTWAPASALYWDNSIFWGGLRGEALYEAVLNGHHVMEVREHFTGMFGRIRTVVRGPDGMFYLTTSNRDGRGSVREGDDKIIRVNPEQFRE